MNQDQRKFLIEKVTSTYKRQRDIIRERIPEKPSLNNHMIAAFLDGSIQYADLDRLKEIIRTRVIKMGTKNSLITEKDGDWRGERDVEPHISIPAELIFVTPQSYKDALQEYQITKERINKELEDLEAKFDTIVLKINIGSNASLDKLVENVDNLIDLNIVNTQLMLK